MIFAYKRELTCNKMGNGTYLLYVYVIKTTEPFIVHAHDTTSLKCRFINFETAGM